MSEKLGWDGKWSASSALWTQDLKDKLDYEDIYKTDSDYIYMGYSDYVSYFNSTSIVKLHNNPESKSYVPFKR